MPRNPNKKQCKATAKGSGKRCQRNVKLGYEVCYYHGERGGAPKNNKNHLIHGVNRKIIYERLTDSEQELFDAITAEPDLTHEMKILRFKLLTLLEPLERQAVVGTPDGAEVVSLQVDEVTKAYAIEKLVDGIRKLSKELGGGEQERFEQLLSALMTPPEG